jgi:Universal stress protein family
MCEQEQADDHRPPHLAPPLLLESDPHFAVSEGRSPPTKAGRSTHRNRSLGGIDMDAQRELLARTVEDWQPKFPDVEISDELIRATPGHALVTASRSARLVVVGAGEAGRFRGWHLGSVSQQVLHHASSPVAIVRRDRHR